MSNLKNWRLILCNLWLIVNGSACALTIIDKPITFDTQRVELTKQYIQQHYKLTPATIEIIPRIIVLHWTSTATLQQAFDLFNPVKLPAARSDLGKGIQVNVSTQFMVDRDGTIYRLMPETWMARHVIGLNYSAIGIENVGGGTEFDDLTPKQLAANIALTRYLMQRYPTITRIIGHYEYPQWVHDPLWLEHDAHYRTVKHDPGRRFLTAVKAGVKSNR
ncbi:MAG: peptidoglycan recognition family protein [Gammaproteobacteria bacterium]